MKVLVADKFETSGIAGLRAAGCEVISDPDLKDDALKEAIARTAGGRAGGARHQGHRADARRRAPVADRAGRRRLQHDRRQGRIAPRHLRLQLPGQERHRRRGAGLRPDPRARPAHPGQRRRAARRQVEQEGVLEGRRALRQDARPARRRQHRPRDDPPGRGVRPQRRDLEPAVRRRRRVRSRIRTRASSTSRRRCARCRSSWCRRRPTSRRAPTSSACTSRSTRPPATSSMPACSRG